MSFDSTCLPIANSALTLVGTRILSSVNDNTKERILIQTNWDTYRQAVLRDGRWKCAKKPVALSLDTTYVAPFGYANRYQLPADFLRVVWINGQDASLSDEASLPWRIEWGDIPANAVSPGVPPSDFQGRFVYTDMSYLYLKYIFNLTDVTQYDPLLVEAFAAYIASKICFHINNSESQRAELEKQYAVARQKAAFVDSSEDPSEEFDADVWLRSRMGMPGFPRDPSTISFPSGGAL